jgi:predicted nucleic acid-binding Zn ribbon protein
MYNPNKKKDFPRKNEALSMSEALQQWVNALRIKQPFNESYLLQHWEDIMGASIAKRTSKIFIKNKKLYVYLNSAPLKQELNMAKLKVVELLNKEVGDKVIEDVEFY